MNKISIAIPTYNPSLFLKDLLTSLSKVDFLNEVVINDDNSIKNEYYKTKKIVTEFTNSSNINISLYKNNKNLGPFRNKFKAVQRCQSDFVYQIDQDNIPNVRSLNKVLKTTNLLDFKNCLILPGSIYPFRFDHTKEMKNKKTRIIVSNRNKILDSKLVAELSNRNLSQDSILPYSLSSGNPIVHKHTYLTKLNEAYEDTTIIADTMATAFYWLKNGGQIYILKNFSHHLRRHKDSYFTSDPRNKVSSDEISRQGSEYYKKIIGSIK